jgi:hypothetical protein
MTGLLTQRMLKKRSYKRLLTIATRRTTIRTGILNTLLTCLTETQFERHQMQFSSQPCKALAQVELSW